MKGAPYTINAYVVKPWAVPGTDLKYREHDLIEVEYHEASRWFVGGIEYGKDDLANIQFAEPPVPSLEKDYWRHGYWNDKGGLKPVAQILQKLVPFEGECDPRFPKLERFRIACNLYYDLYNNGGCNYRAEIGRFFGVSVKQAEENPRAQQAIEFKLDKIILDAWHEQLRYRPNLPLYIERDELSDSDSDSEEVFA